jgi:hypothetical protein
VRKGQIVKSLQKFWLNPKGLERLAVGDSVLVVRVFIIGIIIV